MNGETSLLGRDWHIVLLERYRLTWFDRHFRLSTPLSIFFFIGSVFIYYYSTLYATIHESNSVTDIILSNIPTFDVGYIFVWGGIVLIVSIVALCLLHPRRIPFTLHSLSLFFIIRAFFTTLTHIAPYPSVTPLDSSWNFANHFFSGGDLFFSGHTGAPFLMALIFWHDKKLRYAFLAGSIFMGSIALLGHIHYTIDVLAAFFITYSIYHLALWLFPKEHALFRGDELKSDLEEAYS